jgi:hypothetical protein
LWETASDLTNRVGQRLAELLHGFHVADPSLYDAQTKANEISERFAFSLTIAGHAGVF